MRPRVGITCSSTIHEERDLAALEVAYVAAVSRAGAVPFVLPTLDPSDARAVLAPLDGLVLAGGGDVDPAHYGAAPDEQVDGVDRHRDAYEIALVHEATRRGMPVLGICRGLQVINVARGGTLVQHVPALTGEDHQAKDRARQPVHGVSVVPGTLLERVLGATAVDVNSLHHQAVQVPGEGLVVAARAHDLTIEAAVADDGDRVIGVQWHPELLVDVPAGSELFDWLVQEARQPLAADVTTIAADSWTRGDAAKVSTAVA